MSDQKVLSDQNSQGTLTVRYALTRVEILRTYLFMIPRSPRILLVVFGICAWPGLIHVLVKGSLVHGLDESDLLYTAGWALAMFVLVLLLVVLRAKSVERTLTISNQGIYTEIGSMKVSYPWSKVREIKDVGAHIVIVNRTGNAFFVPLRAFAEDAPGRQEFLDALCQYKNG